MTLLLLPPSETKRDGGIPRTRLAYGALAFPSLTDRRREAVRALRELAQDEVACARALKLSVAAAATEVPRNQAVDRSATMPAIERYTGVLYDALDVASWSESMRERARAHVLIQSALLGPVRATDPIPAYRLSAGSRLPGLSPLATHWRESGMAALSRHRGPILDLRSEGYAALSPVPDRPDAVFVRVVARGDDGKTRALNHFNKKGKGLFVRDLLAAGELPSSLDGLIERAAVCGWSLTLGAAGELELVVPNAL